MADVKHEQEVIVEEQMALVPTKKSDKPPVGDVPMEAGKTGIDSIYDHYQKKLYVFDRSGSMADGMLPEDEANMYKWTPEILEKVREALFTEGFLLDTVTFELANSGADEDEINELPNLSKDELFTKAGLDTDQAVIKFLVAQALTTHPKIEHLLERDYGYMRVTERKIEAVRGAMAKFVEQRFAKYPDAQVGVIGFGSASHIMCYPGAPKPEVLAAVQALDSSMGGTDIARAIKMAIKELKARPSHVGCHHVVLVTDAEAYIQEEEIKAFTHQCKEMNIMFDFIYVAGSSYSPMDKIDPKSVAGMLKRMCEETGGEYAVVSKSSDFEVKFFAASNRLALPPAGRV